MPAMNSIERTDATIHFCKPDRFPVDLHNFQPAANIHALVESAKKYGQD